MQQASIARIVVPAGAARCAFARVPKVTFEPRWQFPRLAGTFPLNDKSISMLAPGSDTCLT
jgi:hypothetical protein